MENKFSESTPQRPQGHRTLNAPLVEMDLHKFIAQIKSEKTWVDGQHNSITIFKSELLRIVLIGLRTNAELKSHATNGVICVQVLEGQVKFITEEHTSTIEEGNMIALQLHEHIAHTVLALTETFFLLTVALAKEE
ncbi:hypothetical protein [Haliscomenobacter hydrossis]|uniref:Cupin 2 conserved barrel domain protein n=1 Tax=Haliscomenobacter hydrossis (strain ATCC 27775 / DSM 1100 / LMG 10767 / O) TaxID=760192 RepID=F4KZG2_HALH1|nr:hypothetical protein [Haliscomenobacter hydrossis]AEE49432.1 hypothetical protein Halhy_1540 [Haliscomenobacter hydrossis DSM 1100]